MAAVPAGRGRRLGRLRTAALAAPGTRQARQDRLPGGAVRRHHRPRAWRRWAPTAGPERPAARRGIAWLRRNQRPDGSWPGWWACYHLHGTSAAVTGLTACG
ncbi:prenyltransferase/squalene oxidase repeat-containing protein, partial [Streptomyces albus]|uniref:prenyltransferase/squalene oxidase repeat-containing protein n=1 Tax=Streptomyces albus TaxID=1888 RepID=UPI0024E0B273